MKKLLFSLLLFFPVLLFGQALSLPSVFFSTRTDMRSQKGTEGVQVLLNGLVSIDDGNGGVYMWKGANTDTDDGFITLQVTGVATGRWKRIGNGNTLKGQSLLSGGVLQTAYTVNFPQALPFTPITIIINPRSSNAAVPSWISSITTTGFTINFASVPVLGTNNIAFDYIAVKQ